MHLALHSLVSLCWLVCFIATPSYICENTPTSSSLQRLTGCASVLVVLSSRNRHVDQMSAALPCICLSRRSRPLSGVRKQEQVQTCQQKPNMPQCQCCSGGYRVPCRCVLMSTLLTTAFPRRSYLRAHKDHIETRPRSLLLYYTSLLCDSRDVSLLDAQ